MAESVDALASGASGSNVVRVRVSLSPRKRKRASGEMADAPALGAGGAIHGGSSPLSPTRNGSKTGNWKN